MGRSRSRRLSGLWVIFKREKDRPEYYPDLTLKKLEELRAQAKERYQRLYPDATECIPMGFVTEHVNEEIIRNSGLKMRNDLDKIFLNMAIAHEALVCEGTYEAGPVGRKKLLKSPFPRNPCRR